MKIIQYVLWVNVLGVDAVMVALCWQCTFAAVTQQEVSYAAAAVLGVSIWLTYTADRLFDVSKLPIQRLQTQRHRFAKCHAKRLWQLWWGLLILDIVLAWTRLTSEQFCGGIVLLMACLLYTGLNQKFAGRFFPKEGCVAGIFAGGVVVFLSFSPDMLVPLGLLAFLCLLNCLMISARESQIDARMGTHSLAQSIPHMMPLLFVASLLLFILLPLPWLLPFATTYTLLLLLHLNRNRLSAEVFHLLADGALILGPAVGWLATLIGK